MRKDENQLILRLRLRDMTIDGMVDGSGPWFMAQKGKTSLGSGHLGMGTRIRRFPAGRSLPHRRVRHGSALPRRL